MNALDWLRDKARRQKPPATGGIIQPGNVPPLEPGPAPFVVPTGAIRSAVPGGATITFHPTSTPTPELVQQMAEALGTTTRTAPVQPKQPAKPSREHTAEITERANQRARQQRIEKNGCTCAYIYSRCYCKK